MGSKSGGNEEQVVKTTPWSPVQRKGLNQGWEAAAGILNTPTSYFPGSTVAGMSDPTTAALSRLESMGLSGSDSLDAARAKNMATINGDFLGSNPYLTQAIETAQRPTMQAYQTAVAPQTDSAFARAGRFGSGAHSNAVGQDRDRLARALSDTAGNISYADYGAERGRMQNAIGMAPGLEQAGYLGPQVALQAGQVRDAQAQRELADRVARFQFEQDEPAMRLSRYLSLLSGNSGQMQTSSAPTYTNPAGGALGGALSGIAAGARLGPWGAGIGAGIGLLGGLLGSR